MVGRNPPKLKSLEYSPSLSKVKVIIQKHGYKGLRKLKYVNINLHVGENPRKFGGAKIIHFTVLCLRLLL